MENRLYIGIDPSLSDTGLSVLSEELDIITMRSIKTGKGLDLSRIRLIVTQCMDEILSLKDDNELSVFIEAIPFARNPNGKTFTRHELVGVLKYELTVAGIDTYMVGNTTLKSKFTGNGKAQKSCVQNEIQNRFQRIIKNDNIADAVALAVIGQEYLSSKIKMAVEKLPKF